MGMDDYLVIGAGLVGLATARAIIEKVPDARITVLEKAADVATAQSGHNSGVIHAGIYYAPGSLKAELCRQGRIETVEFCERYGIPHSLVGKLIVATDETSRARLDDLERRSIENRIVVERIGAGALAELEPNVQGVAALLSPTTGIVDYRRIASAMCDELTAAGVTLRFNTEVTSIAEEQGLDGGAVRVRTAAGGERAARRLVACAGLQADRVARIAGIPIDFRIVPFRGEYFELPAERHDFVKHLIYPVPDPSMPFLGVHISPTIDGRVTVGPNAVLGWAREGYPRGSIRPSDVFDFATYVGFWRMAAHNVRPAAIEMRNSLFASGYLRECHKYAPSLTLSDLGTRSAGIRAQAVRRDGSFIEDFHVERTARQIHVGNAPSPAATSSIPIGRMIATLLLDGVG
ncbi:L-2-hydroxyglutarate oxidase [Salinibacterium sp. M195]|nr:L-2-hydroxyglutarate oxidase [Salinibacterium sp. M195]